MPSGVLEPTHTVSFVFRLHIPKSALCRWKWLLQFMDIPDALNESSLPLHKANTQAHHLTLAHRQPSMPMRANRWMLPPVRNKSPRKTQSNVPKAPSRISRNVGSSDEPGVRTLWRKPESVVDLLGGGGSEDVPSTIMRLSRTLL